MTTAPLSVGFVGLGLMGSRMARRVLDAGFPLTVYNRDPEKATLLTAAGARHVRSARAVAEQADVVISMVADDQAARDVWRGDSGILAGLRRGTILIESSTVSVGWIHELATAAKAAGCPLLDAPVTGSRDNAAAGELVFLVGGPAEAIDVAQPVLAAMGRSIVRLGPSGSGALLKLVNNFMCGVQIVALAEAWAMIERTELNRAVAAAVVTDGAAGSPLVKTVAGRIGRGDYTPNFPLRLMAKDLAYAEAQACSLGVDLSSARAALAVFGRAVRQGYGAQDIAAVIEPLRQSRPSDV